MICGHGSRAKSAEEEFGLLAKGLRARFPDVPVEYGFLEYSAPNIHMGLDRLREAGVTNIVAVPGMLFAATHAKNDIPSVLTTYQDKHPGLTVSYGRELGLHPQMIAAFQALQEAGARADPSTLAGGIWEALLTTAAGMAVAIPAAAALTYFESVIDRIRLDLEDAATRIFIAKV